MEYESIANLTNFTFDHDISVDSSMRYIIHEIIFTIFSCIAVSADAVIIYTIFHFKRLQTLENVFVAHWAIADLCSLMFTPSGYRIVSVIDNKSLPAKFVCVLFQLESTLHLTEVIFVIVVTVDWLLLAFYPTLSEKFRKHHKFLIVSVWIFAFIGCCTTVVSCLQEYYGYFFPILLFVLYAVSFLIVLFLQFARLIRRCLKKPPPRSTLYLTLPTAFTLFWVFVYLTTIVARSRHPVLELILDCLLFGSSVINLALLYWLSKDFNACVGQTFRRTSDQYHEAIPATDGPLETAANAPNEEVATESV